MKVKFMFMDCSIVFPMKNGESKADAEDRLLDILAKNNIELCGWKNQKIEEFDDDPGCIICKHNYKSMDEAPCVGCGEDYSNREIAEGWSVEL